MAPNTKQLNLIVQHLSSADLVGTNKTHVILAQEQQPERRSLTEAESDNYWSWAPEDEVKDQQQEPEAYWDWSENPAVDVLSVDHIVRNLETTRVVEHEDLIHSGLDSNEYWDETSTKDKENKAITPDDFDQNAVDSYWQWPSVNKEDESALVREAIIHEIMESEKMRQMLSADHILENILQEISDAYWRENAEVITMKNSEDYWFEEVSV